MIRRHVRMALASHPERLLAIATLAIVALIATPSLGHSPVTRQDALPVAGERLAQPIWLPHCAMQIVEWRSTSALLAETSPDERAVAVLDDTCRVAIDRYSEFLHSKRLPRLRNKPDVMPAISLLPGNILLDGKSLRALNDLPSRFDAVAPGCCYWGLYVDSLSHLFLRNDPLIRDAEGNLQSNPRFVRTLTHEISHVLSARLGVWDVVGYDRKRDEDLAEDFVAFMGMRFPAESSADDLAFHRGNLPLTASQAGPPDPPEPRSGTLVGRQDGPDYRSGVLVGQKEHSDPPTVLAPPSTPVDRPRSTKRSAGQAQRASKHVAPHAP